MREVQEIRVRRMEILFSSSDRITRMGRKVVGVKKVPDCVATCLSSLTFCCASNPQGTPHCGHPKLCDSLSTPFPPMPLGLCVHNSLFLVHPSLTCAPGQSLTSLKTWPVHRSFLSPSVNPMSLSQMPLVCAHRPHPVHIIPTAPIFYYSYCSYCHNEMSCLPLRLPGRKHILWWQGIFLFISVPQRPAPCLMENNSNKPSFKEMHKWMNESNKRQGNACLRN